MTRSPIYVALDVPTADDALAIAKALAPPSMGGELGFKVGLELYLREGIGIVQRLQTLCAAPVFVDLKLHDIPATVERASANLVHQGVRFFNVHAQGGPEMMQGARAGATKALSNMGSSETVTIIAVTLLTSLSASVLASHLKITDSPTDYAVHLAQASQAAGLDGVVCSPLEVAAIRQALGPQACLVTPGIRPAESDSGARKDDQQRIATPQQALANGASMLVIGRPITQAADPLAAAQRILDSLKTPATC
ncbi:MAG: orotidine-5'-phosphate decarboxylase [Vampirovibrionales bacterium]|nr:orotidine-5'-phosphate decarboxylase [Vampirovibrionales bacterium]